jgi:hypothetical protein
MTPSFYKWMQQFKDDDTRDGILARYLKPTDCIRSIEECAGELVKEVYFRAFSKWYQTCKPCKKHYEEDGWILEV